MSTKLSLEEMREIEETTPFLKPGRILEGFKQDSAISLEDFELVDKGKKMLGKGAYGEVKLVRFKKTQD